MKIIATLLFAGLLTFSQNIQAGEECCESASISSTIEQKLKEIDLSLMVKQYEEIQAVKSKTEVALILLQTEAGNDDEREKQMSLLKHRIERLHEFAANLRLRITDMGKMMAAASH